MKIDPVFEKGKPDEHFAYTAEDLRNWRIGLALADLPASSLRVGLLLADQFLNRKSGRCFPSYTKVAQALGMPESTVRDGARLLVRLGLINTESRGPGKTNQFAFDVDRALEIQRGVSDENSTGRGDENSTGGRREFNPITKERTVEVEPDTGLPGELAHAVHDALLIEDHHSFGPVGPQGVEVPRNIERRKLA
nr:helix-turn-helix domain-containing protein [Rhizobium sp. ACO-34A]